MYRDLREFIGTVDKLGALRRIEGADPRFEMGGITEVAAGLPDCPALPPPTCNAPRWRSGSIPGCDRSTR
jgi:hypothetical protein